MRHKPRNIALLSMLAVLVAGVTASAASASMQYEWKVNGSPLASGASKNSTAKAIAGNPIHIKFKFVDSEVELTASQLKMEGSIQGGVPGTGAATLTLEGVKETKPNSGRCRVPGEKISFKSLKAEIVEGAAGGAGNGKVDLLFSPRNGNVWTEFEFENNEQCGAGKYRINLEGTVLAEIAPAKAEAKINQLKFESGNEYKTKGGPGTGSHLTFAKDPAHLTGGAELELVSKEVFGAF